VAGIPLRRAVTLAFELVDDISSANWTKVLCKIVLFGGLFWLFLVNRPFRAWAREKLERIRYDSR
jgi:hypothetical protein